MIEPTQKNKEMLLMTTSLVDMKNVKVLGLVRGEIVRARWFGRDILASFKTLIGGEIESYTELLTRAREDATQRMIDEAINLGADAIMGVRYETNTIMAGAAEIMVYGTAVKFVK